MKCNTGITRKAITEFVIKNKVVVIYLNFGGVVNRHMFSLLLLSRDKSAVLPQGLLILTLARFPRNIKYFIQFKSSVILLTFEIIKAVWKICKVGLKCVIPFSDILLVNNSFVYFMRTLLFLYLLHRNLIL